MHNILAVHRDSTQPKDSIAKIASIVKTAWIASKYMHQLENNVQIPTTPHCLNDHHQHNVLTCSAVGVVWSLTCLLHSWIVQVSFPRVLKSPCPNEGSQKYILCNGVDLLSDNTYQLLIISYVLASGHDLVTVPVWLSPQASQQRQPHSQGSWLGPNLQAGPHCSRLLMTSWALGKDIGIVPSVWVCTHDTQSSVSTWSWNFRVMLSDSVNAVWRLERARHVQQVSTISYPTFATRFVPNVSIWYQVIRYPMKFRQYL